jgi:adenylate cyclase
LAFVEIGMSALRGKDRGERLFALLGDDAVAKSDAFTAFQSAFNGLSAAASAGDMAAMRTSLEDCRKPSLDGTTGLLAHYETKLKS